MNAPSTPASAYLTLQHDGRWNDLYRLRPETATCLGRSSENPIVVRTESASRRHAEVFWMAETGWHVRDLGSRNGTFVNGRRIESETPLSDGDVISVTGIPMRFTFSPVVAASTSLPLAGDSQQTSVWDPASITDSLQKSPYLHPSGLGQSTDDSNRRHRLLRLSFDVASADTLESAAELAKSTLDEMTSTNHVVLSLQADRAKKPVTLGKPPAGSALKDSHPVFALDSPSQAFLARNILSGDGPRSGRENSLGQLDVESLVWAPIRIPGEDQSLGFIYLTTDADSPGLERKDLEFASAVAEILAVRIKTLAETDQLRGKLRRSRRQVQWLKETLGQRVEMIGHSNTMTDVIENVRLAAPTQATVLIRGESGVGKELIASAIHYASKRADGPMVCMNCAALSPSLLESELFGHEKGAFTGADRRKIGKFEAASGGTILLDEIGEMPMETQTKFLRVLEARAFERVGGHETIEVDVRVVAATNRDLQAMVDEGKFRQDLFYRLHVIEIVVPPLRNRGDDVLLLADHFLQRFARALGRDIQGLSDGAKKKLTRYHWPGNIRELRNAIERAVVLAKDRVIDSDGLLLSPAGGDSKMATRFDEDQWVTRSLADVEREHIYRVLESTDNNKSRASQILGIERSTLDRKLKRYQKDELG